MRIIIGLGNPGEEYASTWHNAGRMFVEYIAEKEGLTFKNVSHKRFSAIKTTGGDTLAIPDTFMNESGIAVREAIKFFELSPEELIVAHDDSDLARGTYKFTKGGGSAGHHGIESIVAEIGTPEFWRIRIGVRNAEEVVRVKAGDFVLKGLSKTDKETLYGVFDDAIVKVMENRTLPSSELIS
jgi:peptidyl-tRNA hydrolase, PTH1 family